jgi:Queuosine salvage protein
MTSSSLPDEVRDACAWVAARARFVRVDEELVSGYARGLPRPGGEATEPPVGAGDPEAVAAYAICMNAINFGSGWWPTIRKRAGLSGYGTMAVGLRERFEGAGHWSAEELISLDAPAVAAVLGQDPNHPLMKQFAATLRDVGAHLLEEHGGRYLGVVEAAETIPALAATFAAWFSFADVSVYEGREVPFFKRAQIATADLRRAGVAEQVGIEELTAFADNLVPHVLRVDGVLRLDPVLATRIEAEELLEHGSPEEIELRACAVHAVELLAAECDLYPAEIDSALWNRGRDARYKSLPRPRSRNTAY